MNNRLLLFLILFALTGILFILDVSVGSVSVSIGEIIRFFSGTDIDDLHHQILLNFRIPKAITAVLAGSALSVAGLLMQTLFRNPLADPYILGVSSGAGLGVAVTTMYAAFVPAFMLISGWATIIAAVTGGAMVLLLVILVSFRLHNSVSLLIVGIMFGTIASSLVSIIQNFSNPDALKLFVLWTFGSLSAVNWDNLYVLIPLIFTGLAISLLIHKKLDGFLLGENYAKGLGVSIVQTRLLIVLATGLLAGGITAFTGPIAFVGVAIPHIARGLFRTSTHRILIPSGILIGSSLLLLCDMLTQIPTYTLPINTVSALFGAPVIIWIILRKR